MHWMGLVVLLNLLVPTMVTAGLSQELLLPAPKVVVTMGDSFTAGNGARIYDTDIPLCYRSPMSWAAQFTRSLNASVFVNRACSDAVFAHVTKARYLRTVRKDQNGSCPIPATNSDDYYVEVSSLACHHFVRPQITVLKEDPTVDLVLFGMGSNDLYFDKLVAKCLIFALRNPQSCQYQIDYVTDNAQLWSQNLTSVLLEIEPWLKPTARIVVMQFPHLVEQDDPYTYQSLFSGSVELTNQLRQMGSILDNSQQAAVVAANRIANRTFVLFYDRAKELFAQHEPNPRLFRGNPDTWVFESWADLGKFRSNANAWMFESWVPILNIEYEVFHFNTIGHTELGRDLYNCLAKFMSPAQYQCHLNRTDFHFNLTE